MANTWIELLIQALIPVVGALLVYAAARVERLIRERVENEVARTALLRLNDTVFDVVGSIQQLVVSELRAASKDGKLTVEEMEQLRRSARDAVMQHLGPKGVEEMRRVLGLDEDAIELIITRKIERAVAELKAGTRRPAS